jgi:hypothetical protein
MSRLAALTPWKAGKDSAKTTPGISRANARTRNAGLEMRGWPKMNGLWASSVSFSIGPRKNRKNFKKNVKKRLHFPESVVY